MKILFSILYLAMVISIQNVSAIARDQLNAADCGQAPRCSGTRDCQDRKQAYNNCRNGQKSGSRDEK